MSAAAASYGAGPEEKQSDEDEDKYSNMQHMNFITLGLDTYDMAVKGTLKSLQKEIKPVPATKELISDLFDVQNVRQLRSRNKEHSWEQQVILMEELHCVQREYKQRQIHLYRTVHESQKQALLRRVCQGAEHAATHHPLLRQKGLHRSAHYRCGDGSGAAVLAALYVARRHRHLRPAAQLHAPHSNVLQSPLGPPLRLEAHQLTHFASLARDLGKLTLLLLLSLLLDFLAELVEDGRKKGRRTLNLRMALDIAKEKAIEIWSDLLQIWSVFALLRMRFCVDYAG